MKRTAVLVTGSRDWTDWSVIANRLKRYPKGTILIHGGARGADTMAGCIAAAMGFVVHVYPYFSDLEHDGGKERNSCMLDALLNLKRYGFDCYVEAFPTASSRGTRNMIKLVKDTNFPLNTEEAA